MAAAPMDRVPRSFEQVWDAWKLAQQTSRTAPPATPIGFEFHAANIIMALVPATIAWIVLHHFENKLIVEQKQHQVSDGCWYQLFEEYQGGNNWTLLVDRLSCSGSGFDCRRFKKSWKSDRRDSGINWSIEQAHRFDRTKAGYNGVDDAKDQFSTTAGVEREAIWSQGHLDAMSTSASWPHHDKCTMIDWDEGNACI
jgi:hypothetical protein